MSRALINRVSKAHEGYEESCPQCPVKAQSQDDYRGFRRLLNSPSHKSPREFKDHKSRRTEKSRNEMKWPTLYSAITCWNRQNCKMPEEAHVEESSRMCVLSAVWQHSPPQKKQEQGKTQVKHCARTTIQHPEKRDYTVGAIQCKRSLQSEMPLTINLAGIKTSAKEGQRASAWSHRLFQEQVTEGRCDLRYLADISAASALDLVTRGRQKNLQQSANTWVLLCKITGERVNTPESFRSQPLSTGKQGFLQSTVRVSFPPFKVECYHNKIFQLPSFDFWDFCIILA